MTTDERDAELVAAWMKELAAQPVAASQLPGPTQIWWKAQLLRQWDEQRTALAPLEAGERVQVATGLGGAAILLVWLWSHVQTLAAPAGLASPGLMITIATTVLLLTAALVAGWWRPTTRRLGFRGRRVF